MSFMPFRPQAAVAVKLDAGAILQELTTRQFVRPHAPLSAAMAAAAGRLGFCDAAGERAILRLELDPAAAVGRLRRTELAQLAHAVCRFARQSRPTDAAGTAAPVVTAPAAT